MTIQKIVKKIGNSHVIIFTKEEREIFKIHKGDIITMELKKSIATSPEQAHKAICKGGSK